MSNDVELARPRRIYPVLYSDNVDAAGRVYTSFLGFEPTFSTGWYISLRHRLNPAYELAIIDRNHETIPKVGRGAVSKLLINIEVEDATAEAARLGASGVTIAQPLRDEPFGQRHVIVLGPDGVLIDVIQEIPSGPEFAAMFEGDAASG